MNTAYLIFPHQLFRHIPVIKEDVSVYLIEEFLFFKQFLFHKQKIAFHRATMKYYESYLRSQGYAVSYIEALEDRCDVRVLIADMGKEGVQKIKYTDPTDCWLEERLEKSCARYKIATQKLNSPIFINSIDDLSSFFRQDKKKYHQSTFYKAERQKRNILITDKGEPVGGKWTYDLENRKKYPKNKYPPTLMFPDADPYYREAVTYVQQHFSNHSGRLGEHPLYPLNHEATDAWLDQFLAHRFMEFGPYEDAIVQENSWLHHSVLTPMLNVGLITPHKIIDRCLVYAEKHDIPINSTEGFLRQIIGWREFIRGIYLSRGSEQRTLNFWAFKRKIPPSFYTGDTGIAPLDTTIKKVLQTGYCHHIERLMVIGNFMLLCEFDPDEVYRWFMELFVDAYDWVMVPNVYGMSQFADGGLMASKPYISSSNYLMKMSNFKRGEWQAIWDGLFWRFMDVQRDFFKQNPRLGMLVNTFDKMPDEKKEFHLNKATAYLKQLDS
jgi:deoxyribodipyrimidine photolyase-related protein